VTRSTPDLRTDGQLVVTGSLAFDQIMVFPGRFQDHILPDKLHVINISFLVSELRTRRGGCAGNIAYTLALLGERPRIVAAAGSDFDGYRRWLIERGVDVGGIEIFDHLPTARCHITSDQSDNQITGFFVGAMQHARELSLRQRAGADPGLVIVAPDDPEAMVRHCREARQAGLPFLFDPSFQVTAMDGESLAAAAAGAEAILVNDYELAVFEEKTGKSGEALFELVGMVVVTLGGEGSEIRLPDGDAVRIPAAPIERMVDPTGAGDAYRAGFMLGLKRGLPLAVCGRLGSVAAAYAVEQPGTQSHAFTREEFLQRYRRSFGQPPAL